MSNDDEWMLMGGANDDAAADEKTEEARKNYAWVEAGNRNRRLRGCWTSTSTSTSVSTPSTSRFSLRFSFLGGGHIAGYVLKLS